MIDELTRDDFARQLNTPFGAELQDRGTIRLDLIEVSPVRSMGGSEAFSIVFRGPAGAFLPQASYQFRHDELGAFELFIVPIRQDAHGFYYEAIFNRLRQEGSA